MTTSKLKRFDLPRSWRTATVIAIPKAFYRDHIERDLPAPPIVRETRIAFFIDTAHPDFDELVNDAEFYAHPDGPDAAGNVPRTAKCLLRAIRHPHRY